MKQRSTWISVLAVVVLATGLYMVIPNRKVCLATRTIDAQAQSCTVTYKGIDGKNALEILKSSHKVETKTFSFGEMVQSIDGISSPSTHFWAFYVNGKQAEVGAGDYQTKPEDEISWKLEKI